MAGKETPDRTGDFDYREAFREQVIMRRDEDGQYVYRGQARHLLNVCAGYVKPATGEFYMSQQRASDLLGVKMRDRGRGPVADLFRRFRQDGIIEQVRRGAGNKGKAYATVYRVIVTTPADEVTTPSEQGGTSNHSDAGRMNRKISHYPPKSEPLPPQQDATTPLNHGHYPRTTGGLSSSTDFKGSGTTTGKTSSSSEPPGGGPPPKKSEKEDAVYIPPDPCTRCEQKDENARLDERGVCWRCRHNEREQAKRDAAEKEAAAKKAVTCSGCGKEMERHPSGMCSYCYVKTPAPF